MRWSHPGGRVMNVPANACSELQLAHELEVEHTVKKDDTQQH